MKSSFTFDGLRGDLRFDVAMARHTSWRAGGLADAVYVPADVEDLALFLRRLPLDVPVTVLGLGSNVLIRDGGIRGVVVLMRDNEAVVRTEDDGTIYASAGLTCAKLARFAAAQGKTDAAFLAGIPGTVGGALAMNAGCYGGETWNHVARVETVTRDGERNVRAADEYEVAYREVACKIPHKSSPEFFTGAWFHFSSGDASSVEAAQTDIKALLAKRLASQPLEWPNAGSVFRNPPGDYAARLIESCGLKGLTMGGASVSEKHANFIVNPKGAARAADIEALIVQVQQTVEAKTGVRLQPEVKILGEAV
ncbi:MAG: UDP-N-acetylmuramate dehydrogenase [Proteobacteria bacterium]|nr:UDP-N-acetylmuramate dehydrogenase [Pseudomonadota bacterium]MCL2307168.1 UDP-N-acetylmuramate dehydrogenase [Pseudomonadota bacterium]